MSSRSRSRRSSRSSLKSSFKSASILEQGGQPALRDDAPSLSNTAPRDKIEFVPRTSQPESPHILHPSEPQSPPAGGATSAPTNTTTADAGTSMKTLQSNERYFESGSVFEHDDQPLLQDEDTMPDTAPRDEIKVVTRTLQPGSVQLSHPSPPGSWPTGGVVSAPAATGNTAPPNDPPLESDYEGESPKVHINSPASGQRDRFPPKRFGLNKDQLRGQPAPASFPMDYKKKYPEDPIYKETEENARVFHVYNDESQIFDNDMILEAGDNLDILLVFAGLFASVLTTFVAQTSQSLSPDKTEISNSLLREMISLQRAQENGTSFTSVPAADTSFTASRSDIWVNSLWFVSLALSLSTALLAVIAKQWLRQYSSFFSGTPRERALIRQFRYDGLEKWRVRLIIGLLPTILHVSLFLFLAGLVVFLLPLNNTLARVVAGIAGFLCIAYIVTNVLPIIFIECPYRTPLSQILISFYGASRITFVALWYSILLLLVHTKVAPNDVIHRNTAWLPSSVITYQWKGFTRLWPRSLKESERARANERDKWDRPLGITGALIWLAQTTSDISAKAILAEAAGSADHPARISDWTSFPDVLRQRWPNVLPRIRAGQLFEAEEERIAERVLRGALRLQFLWTYVPVYGVEEPIHCQTHSMMLMVAVYNHTSTLHIEDEELQDLLPTQVFGYVAKRNDLSTELEAPNWMWWSLLTRALGAIEDSEYTEQIVGICANGTTPHIDSHKEDWLREVDIPSTLQSTIRERMLDAYRDVMVFEKVSKPYTWSEFSLSFVHASAPPPFSTVSLATFLFENFAQFTGFWMETGDIHSHIQNSVSTDNPL